jgi:hypothetical protein
MSDHPQYPPPPQPPYPPQGQYQPPPSYPPPPPTDNLFTRLLGFEHLIGALLIKIVYWLGLAGIALYILFGLAAVSQMARYGGGMGGLGLLAVLLGGAFALLFWRFMCELWMVVFKIHDRLGDIRDRLPPKV